RGGDEAGLAHRHAEVQLRILGAQLLEHGIDPLGDAYRIRARLLEEEDPDGLLAVVPRDRLLFLESVLDPGHIPDRDGARAERRGLSASHTRTACAALAARSQPDRDLGDLLDRL